MKKLFLISCLLLFSCSQIFGNDYYGSKRVVVYSVPNQGPSIYSYGTILGINIGYKYSADAGLSEKARSEFTFDLRNIPSNATITSVTLSYAISNPGNFLAGYKFTVSQITHYDVPQTSWQNIGQATVLFSDVVYGSSGLSSNALNTLVGNNKGGYLYLGTFSQNEAQTDSWADIDLTLSVSYTTPPSNVTLIADNNFIDNSGNGTHGSIIVDDTSHTIPSSGYTITKDIGQSLTLSAVSSQTNNLGYQMTWNTGSCEPSRWTQGGQPKSSNQTYTFTVSSSDNNTTYLANFHQNHSTTSGQLTSDETWISNLTLSGNVTVPAGKTLTITSCATVNLVNGGNRYSIISTGGSIVVDNGATINGLRARLTYYGTLKGLCPTIQTAIDSAQAGYWVEIQSGNFSGNLDVNSKNDLTILGQGSENTNINGNLTFHSCYNLRLSSFHCNKVTTYYCDYANIFCDISGTSSQNGIELYCCSLFGQYGNIDFCGTGLRASSSDGETVASYSSNNTSVTSGEGGNVWVNHSHLCESTNYDFYAVQNSRIISDGCYVRDGIPRYHTFRNGTISFQAPSQICGLSKVSSTAINQDALSPSIPLQSDDPAEVEFSNINNSYFDLFKTIKNEIKEEGISNTGKLHDQYVEVINNFKNFIKNYPQSSLARVALTSTANSFRRYKDYDEMKNFLDEIINDKNLAELKGLAECFKIDYYKNIKDFDSAVNEADACIKNYPDDNELLCDALLKKGIILSYDKRQLDKAAECFSTIVVNYPDNPLVEFAKNELDVLGKGLKKESEETQVADKYFGFSTSSYPNPFNPTTTISYTIPKDGRVEIKVYDALGREVATLVNEVKPAGKYNVVFNAANLASGVYFYRLTVNDLAVTKKIILMK